MLDIIPPTFSGSDHEKVEQMGAYIVALYDSINRQFSRCANNNESTSGTGNTSEAFFVRATYDWDGGNLACDCSFEELLDAYMSERNIRLVMEATENNETIYIFGTLALYTSNIFAFALSIDTTITYLVCDQTNGWYVTNNPFE